MDVCDIIEIKAKTQKGNSIIGNYGNFWIIEKIKNNVIFDSRIGPWLFIKSCNLNNFRWIKLYDDINFEIIIN